MQLPTFLMTEQKQFLKLHPPFGKNFSRRAFEFNYRDLYFSLTEIEFLSDVKILLAILPQCNDSLVTFLASRTPAQT